MYGYCIFLRLEHSFNGSTLALSRVTVCGYKALMFLMLTLPFLWMVMWSMNPEFVCINAWSPIEAQIGLETIYFCQIAWSTPMIYMIFVAVAICSILNSIYGGIFMYKLNNILLKGPGPQVRLPITTMCFALN